jgi:hypothetical protein
MSVGAQDANNMVFKSQMVGVSQNLRTDQTVKETDKQRETEQARTDNPESAETGGSKNVTSNGGVARTAPRRRMGRDSSLHRLGHGQVDWSENESGGQGKDWLPPSLQPHSRGAGSANQWNIPYWLMAKDQPQNDSPIAQHKRLLNGLRTMVNTEIQQYTKQNEPLYAKRTLREIYSVLSEEGPTPQSAPGATAVTNDPAGMTPTNFRRAMNTFNMLENPQPQPGEAFEMVA